MDTNLILTTKLYPPRVTPDLVPRKHLLDRLKRNRDRPMTLISAPAGYGKSVLASMWLQSSGRSYGWVSLDESDNDLPTFLAYLLAGIQAAIPDAPLQQSQALLELPALPPISTVASYLLNDLDRIKRPFFLTLDDIHVIREFTVFELLSSLLKHPAPRLHLVVIGRKDPALPIASLRASNLINEIRARDLRFSAVETAQFFKEALQQEISDDVAAEWTERTEGWVAALRLAAISSANRRNTLTAGSAIEGKSHFLREYLLAEVFARLSPSRQACLMRTSILDRFCAPLCEVVCEETGEATTAEALSGEEYLRWLRESNLFLIALDGHNEWFRFHHLFQAYLGNLLEQRLGSQEIVTIQLRASKWLAENGHIDEAIQHALKAGDVALALDYVYQRRYQLMNNENWIKLERLIKLFPDDLIMSDPVLAVTMAWVAFHRGYVQDRPRYLDAAVKSVAALPPNSPVRTAVSAQIIPLAGLRAVILGQPATHIIADAERAVETLPEEDYNARGLAIGILVAGFQMAGNWQQGLLIGREAITNPDFRLMMRASIFLYMCASSFMEGALDELLFFASQGLQLNKEHNLWKESGRRRYYMAIVYYLRNDLENAEKYLSETTRNPHTIPNYLAQGTCALARLYQQQNRPDEADQILEKARTHLHNIGDTILLEIIRAFQVELALHRNNLIEAQHLSQTVDFERPALIWYHYIPQLTPIKLLLHQGGQKNLEKAKQQLAIMENHLRPINRKMILIDVLALQALVDDALGNTKAAYEKTRESLHLAEPGGFIRNYVDLGLPLADLLTRLYQEEKSKRGDLLPYIELILDAFSPATLQKSAHSVNKKHHLTAREMETLNYLSTELSPQEIAEHMVISPATVRTHIHNIYAKLEVNSRFQAVQFAQEIGLL